MSKAGAYFKDKQEAVEFYKNSEANLKDKPDWLIECIIDFAIQYPNYKEYLECEGRIKSGQELTAKKKKKYGTLKWDPMHTKYKDGDVLHDCVDINDAGTFDDVAKDREAFEKINKYGLDFPGDGALPPDDYVKITVQQPDGTTVTGKAPVSDPGKWEIEVKPTEE